MAIHKKEEFTQKEQDLAAFAKALAHPARIAILKLLAQRNECICGEIVNGRDGLVNKVEKLLAE